MNVTQQNLIPIYTRTISTVVRNERSQFERLIKLQDAKKICPLCDGKMEESTARQNTSSFTIGWQTSYPRNLPMWRLFAGLSNLFCSISIPKINVMFVLDTFLISCTTKSKLSRTVLDNSAHQQISATQPYSGVVHKLRFSTFVQRSASS
jgi:hypothetical protein